MPRRDSSRRLVLTGYLLHKCDLPNLEESIRKQTHVNSASTLYGQFTYNNFPEISDTCTRRSVVLDFLIVRMVGLHDSECIRYVNCPYNRETAVPLTDSMGAFTTVPRVRVRVPLLEEENAVIRGRRSRCRIRARDASPQQLCACVGIDSKLARRGWLRATPGVIDEHTVLSRRIRGARSTHRHRVVFECETTALNVIDTWVKNGAVNAC